MSILWCTNKERTKEGRVIHSVVFTVNDTEEGFRVVPSVNEDGEVFVGNIGGYPEKTFDSEEQATEHAMDQIKKFCARWLREGKPVTSATVVTPRDCIEVDPMLRRVE